MTANFFDNNGAMDGAHFNLTLEKTSSFDRDWDLEDPEFIKRLYAADLNVGTAYDGSVHE